MSPKCNTLLAAKQNTFKKGLDVYSIVFNTFQPTALYLNCYRTNSRLIFCPIKESCTVLTTKVVMVSELLPLACFQSRKPTDIKGKASPELALPKKRHAKQYTASFSMEYSNHGNSLYQLTWKHLPFEPYFLAGKETPVGCLGVCWAISFGTCCSKKVDWGWDTGCDEVLDDTPVDDWLWLARVTLSAPNVSNVYSHYLWLLENKTYYQQIVNN